MSTTDTRAAFEAWATKEHPEAHHIMRDDGQYKHGGMRDWWPCWQAATHAAKGKGRYCAHCQREADNECKNCKGYGVVTHISGMTPDNYEECNEVCPDCKGEGTEAAKATGTAGELPPLPWGENLNREIEDWLEVRTDKEIHKFIKEYGQACAEAERQSLMQLFLDPENQPTQYGTVLVEAARQPAAVAIKTWQERMTDGRRVQNSEWCKDEEIAELRAALAATHRSQPAPVVAVKTWQERVKRTDDATAMKRRSIVARDEEIADLRAAIAATNRSQP